MDIPLRAPTREFGEIETAKCELKRELDPCSAVNSYRRGFDVPNK
jgi:hypothetical protein